MDDFGKAQEVSFKAYQNSLLYTKTCTLAASSEEEGIEQVYKNYILEELKPQPVADQAPSESAMNTYLNARKLAALKPRLISV